MQLIALAVFTVAVALPLCALKLLGTHRAVKPLTHLACGLLLVSAGALAAAIYRDHPGSSDAQALLGVIVIALITAGCLREHLLVCRPAR